MKNRNIILIGMAGCGKSTLGVFLAKALGFHFLDTDLLIQQREGKLLQQIINEDGLDRFKAVEEATLLSLETTDTHEKNAVVLPDCGTVIATGGSAVYYPAAMEKLKAIGTVVWLSLPYTEIERRINNIKTRGIALAPGQTLYDVYNERQPLYRRWSDITIRCQSSVEANVESLLAALRL